MMAPVGLKIIALSVISERITASRQGPSYVHALDHSRHQVSVRWSASLGSIRAGDDSWEAYHVSTNGISFLLSSFPFVLSLSKDSERAFKQPVRA